MNGEIKRPIEDPDSIFVAIDPKDTGRLMDELRTAGIQFDVSVNPHPGEGEALCDIFWFWKLQDEATQKETIDRAKKRT